MNPITWHTAREGDRIFARKTSTGPFYTGTVTRRGRRHVRIHWDIAGGDSKRPYAQVFCLKELFNDIAMGAPACIMLAQNRFETEAIADVCKSGAELSRRASAASPESAASALGEGNLKGENRCRVK